MRLTENIAWGRIKSSWTRDQCRVRNLLTPSHAHYRECRAQNGRPCNCAELRIAMIVEGW
ncbi:MAG: hypothetical protein KGH75_10915 [Rhodospirillales bacterium]|nr:hypothetical protein [Rhodospirillales bacterium]